MRSPAGLRAGGDHWSCMRLLSLEQDRALVQTDFAFYGRAVVVLAVLARHTLPSRACLAPWSGLGRTGGLDVGRVRTAPLRAARRSALQALACAAPCPSVGADRTPTLLTAALFVLLVGVPAWWLFPPCSASALALGVMLGYLAYIVTSRAVAAGRPVTIRRALMCGNARKLLRNRGTIAVSPTSKYSA